MQFVRLVVFGFLALSVVYVCVALYSRSVRLERLERQWDADPKGDAGARRQFLEAGMAEYKTGLKRRLILLVYVVPTVVIAAILYTIN